MNIKVIIGVVLGIFVAIGLAAVVVSWYTRPATPVNTTGGISDYPTPAAPDGSGGFAPPPGSNIVTSSSTYATIAIRAVDGSTVVVNDFVNNGTTIPDRNNPGRYLIAGDLGSCVLNPDACKAGDVKDFNIYYDSGASSFTIALLREPLGEVRAAAEQYLVRTLGVSAVALCKMRYYVGTTYDVNAEYASENLGFSFCQAGIKLP